jgi:tRNA-specific 2-thiouridylase
VKAADFGGAQLLRAGDENKDQTYFLYRVNQSALAKTLFPLGDFTSKNQVRQEAEKRSLATAGKKDSQGICFIGTVGIRDFLSQFVETKPGDIIEKDSGRVVGRHDGAIFYTFGQRHGLSVGGGLPYYVVGKDMLKNQVYVSADLNNAEFWRDEIELTDVHWINQPPIEESPATASSNSTASSELAVKTVQIRVRHRAPLKPARLVASSAGSNSTASSELAMADRGKNSTASSELAVVKVKLDEPERAIAPGQSIVIYDGEIVLGGGIVR